MMVMFVFAAPSRAGWVETTVVRADAKTGKLVRAKVVTPKPAAKKAPPANLNELIERVAREQGVEAPLVHSVIQTESNYNPAAVSPRGALGIMQLIPSTARRFGVSDLFDAQDNIEGGVRYLKFLLDYYQGDYPKAIAAYNAGEGAVDKFKGIPPYAETRNYVLQVAKHLKSAREEAAKQPKPAPNLQVAETAETPRPIETSVGTDGRIYYRTP